MLRRVTYNFSLNELFIKNLIFSQFLVNAYTFVRFFLGIYLL